MILRDQIIEEASGLRVRDEKFILSAQSFSESKPKDEGGARNIVPKLNDIVPNHTGLVHSQGLPS